MAEKVFRQHAGLWGQPGYTRIKRGRPPTAKKLRLALSLIMVTAVWAASTPLFVQPRQEVYILAGIAASGLLCLGLKYIHQMSWKRVYVYIFLTALLGEVVGLSLLLIVIR